MALLVANLDPGGTECQAADLACRLPAAGWSPVVIVAGASEGALRARLDASSIPVHALGAALSGGMTSPRFWAGLMSAIHRLAGICRRERIAILQSFLFWENQIAIPAAALATNVRAVVTGRRNLGRFKDSRAHYQTIENWTNPLSAAIVCNSLAVRSDVIAREAVADHRLRVIPNGLNAERFATAAPEPADGLLPIDWADAFVVGCVGNLKPQKRHDILLEAAAIAQRQLPSLRLAIVGRDLGERAELETQCRRLGIENLVRFTGEVRDPAPLLRRFSAFASASDFEGLSNAMLEAMAAGCPVIATPAGGAGEVLRDGREGISIPHGDPGALAAAILRLHRDPDLARRLAAAAQRRVAERYGFDRLASAHAELYESLL